MQREAGAKTKAFIIHLERAAARRAHAEALARELPQKAALAAAEILAATDAQSLTQEQIAAVYRRKIFAPFYPFTLNAAEIACFLSHRRAWQALLAQNCDSAFITEDDMRPRENFAEAAALAQRHIAECGLIRFPHRDREKGRIIAESGQTRLIRPRGAGLGAVAYMLSRAAAVKLLAATKHFDRPLDVALQMFWVTKVRPFSLVPGGIAEISAELGGSTLAQKRNLGQKLRHEILRPLYRAQISLLSRLKG